MNKNQIVIEKYVILKSFVIYLVIRFISASWIYFVGKYKIFSNIKGFTFSIIYLLLPVFLSFLIPLYFFIKKQKKLAIWLTLFLLIFLLLGFEKSPYVNFGIPLFLITYEVYKTRSKKTTNQF